MIIETERLVLTPAAVTDYDDLRRVWSDADFTRFISGPMNGETVWLRLLRDLGHWQVHGHGNWSARLKGDGRYLGSVGVFDYKRAIEPEFDAMETGWGFDPAFQGQGYASEALTAMLAHADGALGIARTLCMISPENEPSLKLALKSDYKPLRESTFHGDTVFILER